MAGAAAAAAALDATGLLWEHYFPPSGGDGGGPGPAPLRNYLHPALACARVPTAGPDGVKEGRGVVARADIKQGELLMVVKPLAAADVGAVYEAFRAGVAGAGGEGRRLEALVEDEMVKELRRLLAACPGARRVLAGMANGRGVSSCSSSSRGVEDGGGDASGDGGWPLPDLGLLVKEAAELQEAVDEEGGDKANGGSSSSSSKTGEGEEGEEEEAWLRAVLRHNAHGPEFKAYAQIEHDWRAHIHSSPTPHTPPTHIHPRLGGLYPLPSLLNHACLANACRVFLADGAMLVRATQPIKAGEEVRWPYVPPLQPYAIRQAALQAGFGFRCRCPRCRLEGGERDSNGDNGDDGPSPTSPSVSSSDGGGLGNGGGSSAAYAAVEGRAVAAVGRLRAGVGEEGGLEGLVDAVEGVLQTIAPTSAEHRRWCRASFLDLYFALFNDHHNHNTNGGGGEEQRQQRQQRQQRMARLRNELHFALVAVNNCSTEHLSLLHTCYEAAGHQDGPHSKLSRFWLGQLTTALTTRYGPPPSMDALRKLLQHTRLLLRTQDGYRRAGVAGSEGEEGRGWFL